MDGEDAIQRGHGRRNLEREERRPARDDARAILAADLDAGQAHITASAAVGAQPQVHVEMAVERAQIVADDGIGPAVRDDDAILDHDRAGAELLDEGELVADDEHCPPVLHQLLHLADALGLEGCVTDRQHLVDDEDFRLDMSRHGEAEPQIHAARIMLHRRVDEVCDAGEVDDRIELGTDLAAAHAEDRAVQIDVLAPRQFTVEAGADFQQATEAPGHVDAPRRGVNDAREDLEQGALARAVATENAKNFTRLHIEVDVAQGPEGRAVFVFSPAAAERRHQRLAQVRQHIARLASAISLRDAAHLHGSRRHPAHNMSARLRSMVLK